MQIHSAFPLTSRQKWELGLGLAVIYVPIRIYMNVLTIDQPTFLHKLPLWFIELSISVLFFTLWITVIELLQTGLANLFGDRVLDRFGVVNQLLTVLIAIGLAVMFNSGFRVLWHWMESVWDHKSFDTPPLKISEYPLAKRRANNSITVMALMVAYYLAANKRVFEKLQRVYLNEERLEKENIKAHFSALKNQVSPHFLFNNFSVLTSLVESDQKLSVLFINQLSKAYRYILEQSDFDSIKLNAEIEFLQTYVFLLKIRFEDKLKVDIDIPSDALTRYAIVPLTLQLLVENAVKHNQMSTERALVITIQLEDQFLVVSNPIQLRTFSEPSTKLGLQNIRNRYKLLIDRSVVVNSDGGLFTVKIPLIS